MITARNEQEPATGLTPMDIRALREADTVCFDTEISYGPESWQQTFTAGLRAIKQLDKPSPWESSRTYRIAADARLENYHDGYRPRRAHESVYGSSPTWQTIASLLRPGDQLTINWIAGNDNQTMEQFGITQDEINLIVQRGDKRLQFAVQDRICLLSSSARMVSY